MNKKRMNKQEWLNALTTLAPIIGIPILAFVVIFVKSKYFVFFVFCYVIFALILTGVVQSSAISPNQLGKDYTHQRMK